MSLETELNRLSAAVEALTAVLQGAQAPGVALDMPATPVSTSAVPPVNTKAPRAVKPEAKPDPAPAAPQETVEIPAPEALTIDDCRKALAKMGEGYSTVEERRAAALAVLRRFGAAKIPDIAVERYGEFVAACAEAE